MTGLRHLQPGAKVLDFACGRGRHAQAALQRGLSVLAVDRDAGALQELEAAWANAGERLLPVGVDPGLQLVTRQSDLEADPWPFGAESFDAVVVCNYLFRPRLDELPDLLRPGGLFIYETFAVGNERYGRPSNPEYLLVPGELMSWAGRHGLHVLAYEDGFVRRGRGARVQRLRAIRPPADLEAFALE